MTRQEFDKAKIGDKVRVVRGYDNERDCEIVYKEDEFVLIRTIDGKPFESYLTKHGKLRLTNWREIRLIKE